MTTALDVIEEYLDWRGWPSVRMDGSTPSEERGQLVDRFNKDSSLFVFLLSTRAGGVGLNLQAADTAIMYDGDWNPQIDLQAQARVHRLGQTKQVWPPLSSSFVTHSVHNVFGHETGVRCTCSSSQQISWQDECFPGQGDVFV